MTGDFSGNFVDGDGNKVYGNFSGNFVDGDSNIATGLLVGNFVEGDNNQSAARPRATSSTAITTRPQATLQATLSKVTTISPAAVRR